MTVPRPRYAGAEAFGGAEADPLYLNMVRRNRPTGAIETMTTIERCRGSVKFTPGAV
jgi:hypothetical protein